MRSRTIQLETILFHTIKLINEMDAIIELDDSNIDTILSKLGEGVTSGILHFEIDGKEIAASWEVVDWKAIATNLYYQKDDAIADFEDNYDFPSLPID